MDMKNAKNTHYLHINNKTENINAPDGVIVMNSRQAWQKFPWCREFFTNTPKEGYFVHIKKQTNIPILTCALINMKNVGQKMQNLLVIEKGIKAKAIGYCASTKANLCGEHSATGKIILKQDAELDYLHTHSWANEESVQINYEFILEKNASLRYKYNAKKTSQKMNIMNKITLKENALADVDIKANCKNTNTKIYEELFLNRNSSGTTKIKIVGEEKSVVKSVSKINALAKSKGHLDCAGLLTKKNAQISLLPELNCENKDAELTHEASVGKIDDEALHYLKTRGLSRKKATKLITEGFLRI